MLADWLILLIFPPMCALIGYITNVVAVKMIFRPHERIQIGSIAFQGVLPKHQRHFSRLLAKIVVRNFTTTKDLVRGLNKPSVIDQIERIMRAEIPKLVSSLKNTIPPERQALLTPQTVDMFTEQVVSQLRANAPEIIAAVSDSAADSVDLFDVISDKVMGLGASGLERIIYSVSKKELDFIEYYGAIFGFLLGLFQFLVLKLVGPIALPVVGAVVGTVTNWLAIQMLFYPREPTKYLGIFEYQGMFPKRQYEMASMMGKIAAKELIVPREIFTEIVEKIVPKTLDESHIATVETAARSKAPQMFQVLDALVEEDARPAMRQKIASHATGMLHEASTNIVEVATANVDLDAMLESKLKSLSKSDFELLIRGLFEREEIYLILYGGLLGAIMGALQLWVV